MNFTMNMSSYEIECDPLEQQYGTEILCAGWNPAVELLCQQQQLATELLVTAAQQYRMPTDISTAIAEVFLEKMYANQR